MSAVRKKRVAILDDYQDAALRFGNWQQLEADVEVEVFREHLHDEAGLIERLRPFDVVCLMRERTPLPARVIDQLPNLRLIVTTAIWNAVLDSDHARRRGIVVSGTDSIQSGTPELTWLLILALARRFEQERESMRTGGWQTAVGMDLRKRTLGLMGLGNVGKRVARVANAFGMRVLAWSQNLTPEDAGAAGATRVDLATLLAQSDFVSLHLRLSERTHHIIDAATLRGMQRHAYLVNTSRGALVDTDALVAALRDGVIAGAALDTYDIEPLPPQHPLRTLPNVVATPHIGYVTEATYRVFFEQVVEDIRGWLDGHPLRLVGSEPAGAPGETNLSAARATGDRKP
jgi:phosphoglycerate dehydrogenase-like enzyme